MRVILLQNYTHKYRRFFFFFFFFFFFLSSFVCLITLWCLFVITCTMLYIDMLAGSVRLLCPVPQLMPDHRAHGDSGLFKSVAGDWGWVGWGWGAN